MTSDLSDAVAVGLECPAERRRAALDDIVSAADDSRIKLARPVRFWHRFRVWLLAAIILVVVTFESVRRYRHQVRVEWVRAVQQAGLTARLEERFWPSRLPRPFDWWLVRPRVFWEVAVLELHNQADLKTLLSCESKSPGSVTVFVYFNLTPMERTSLFARCPKCMIQRRFK